MIRLRIATLNSSIVALVALAACGAAMPAGALADGLPVPGGVDTTHQGVLSATGAQRFIAVSRGSSTLVETVAVGTGTLLRSTWIAGAYAVPGVTVSGDTSGLSEDGSSLVLIHPRSGFPQARTSMVLLDPTSLRVRRRIELHGDLSFDAISPDGSTAYLIEYPDPRDPTNYRLREYDLGAGALVAGALRPENDPGEEMRGFPLSRASGLGGRWEYTLYDGGNIYRYGRGEPGEPFVHAIDTVGRTTLCIDLGWIPRRSLGRIKLQLSESGDAVEVVDPGEGVLGTIDTATGEAQQALPVTAASMPSTSEERSSVLPQTGLALTALAGLAGFGMLARRRRSAS